MSDIKNSCDGCCAGMPIVGGLHINEKSITHWNRVHMACAANLYGVPVTGNKNNFNVFDFFDGKEKESHD